MKEIALCHMFLSDNRERFHAVFCRVSVDEGNAGCDVLGDILSGSNIMNMKSADVIINRDGMYPRFC